MTTIYITKYVLTTGIQKVEAEIKPSAISDENYAIFQQRCFLEDKDFFYTESDALANAEWRRANKLKSLQKQIDKLKTLEIKVK